MLSSCCEAATEGGLKIICPEVPGCWSSTTTSEVGCADADEGFDGCCTLAITVTGCVVAVCVGCTTGDLLTFCDLSLSFFSLVLYFTEKLHYVIPEGLKVSLFKVSISEWR